jgi:D-lactate dehydrogenase (cytochrome)
MAADLPNSILEEFDSIVGPGGLVTDDNDLAPHLTEWRGLYSGRTPVMLMPADTAEVAAVLRICQARGIGVVPQGGNTGLVGGAIPHSTPQAAQILMSAARMNTIRTLDPVNYTITAEAGCLLAQVQEAAESVDRLFPLSLAAEGSCQLGGNISTNAGGTNVLRYGNTRDLVMGVEVVLPDGSVFEGLRGLRKDNSGYDLKQLFIGAEGTLGFITAATCKLFPRPRSQATAIVAVPDPIAAVGLHSRAREALGDQLTAFELINQTAMELVLTHIPGARDPLSDHWPWYVLLELGSARSDRDADSQLEEFLAGSMAGGLVHDGVLAQNASQRETFWRLRHSISEAQKNEGAGIKHDISVPLSRLAEFIACAETAAHDRIPGVVVVTFGHLGDGNLHFNLNQPQGMDKESFLGLWGEMSREIHTIAVELGGSFSAEHGVGTLKRDELARLKGRVELDLMRRVKKALDPAGIMNPGKIFPIINMDRDV